ncbi:MAG: 30S ribosomal protein S5 [Nitrososphaerales archaeon]
MKSVQERPEWKPRTKLGMLVAAKQITSIDEIFENGYRIQEAEIVRALLPDIRNEVVHVGIVQKQTDAGEMTRFSAIVAVGNDNGWLGIGKGKASQMRTAIDKATNAALLNLIPIKLGCGSWECRCNKLHSVPFRVQGKGGSVRVEIHPGPRGLGIVAGENIKSLLKLAGIKDAWTRTYGATNTMPSTTKAIYNALRSTYSVG